MRLHPSFANGTGKNGAASIASRLQTGGGTWSSARSCGKK
jgi:hypothetical protein